MDSILITFLASFFIWFLFLGLFVLWVIDGRIKKEQVAHALLAVILAWIVTAFIKDLLPYKRPFVYDGLRPKTFTVPYDNTFPSTHSAVAFALATTIVVHDRKVGIFFLLGAGIVAIARILADVHYPVDVLAGAVFGIASSWAVGRVHLFGLIKRRA